MLRHTAIKLLSEKLNSRSCVKAVDALHECFYPRLHWYDKCTLIYKVHVYKSFKHGWKVERTAEYCELNYQYVLESLRLYEGVLYWPNLKLVPNRRIAVKFLQCEFPAHEIDGHLISRGISTMTEGITE